MAQDFDPAVDIRDTIAHGRGYSPNKLQHEPTPFKEYPKWVRAKTGSVVANSRAEEDAILGTVQEQPKSVSVDIANLGQSEPVQVSKPRGRPKKTPVVLPPDLG